MVVVMGKYLDLIREAEGCAKSAESAVSPPAPTFRAYHKAFRAPGECAESPVECAELERRCRDRLASFKAPRGEKTAFCLFEYIYFSRPDSIMEGRSIYLARVEMGKQLAREHPCDADVAIERVGRRTQHCHLLHVAKRNHHPTPTTSFDS